MKNTAIFADFVIGNTWRRVHYREEIAEIVTGVPILPYRANLQRIGKGNRDFYEDALIYTLQVTTVQSDVIFAEMNVKDRKIILQIGCSARVNVLLTGLTPAMQF